MWNARSNSRRAGAGQRRRAHRWAAIITLGIFGGGRIARAVADLTATVANHDAWLAWTSLAGSLAFGPPMLYLGLRLAGPIMARSARHHRDAVRAAAALAGPPTPKGSVALSDRYGRPPQIFRREVLGDGTTFI